MTDQELGKAVEEWGKAHRADLVRDLIYMVNHKSVTDPGEGGYAFGTDCKVCADAMMDLAQGYGFVPENDDYYTISLLMPGRTPEREIGILGHLDVVPEGEGWHYEPYNAIEKDGFVIGRGSGDNKGGVMMSLYVMKALKEMGIEFDHTIRLICGFNEEAGMKDVDHYLEGHKAPEYTIVCDGGWAMCIGEKGILNTDLTQKIGSGNLVSMTAGIAHNAVPDKAVAVLSGLDEALVLAAASKQNEAAGKTDFEVSAENGLITVTALGKAGHAAFPWVSDNAVYKLMHFLNDNRFVTGDAAEAVKNIAEMFSDNYGTDLGIAFEDEPSGKTTCVASVLRLENGVLSQHLDVRFAVTQSSEELLAKLNSVCEGRGIAIEDLSWSGPRYTDPEAPVTKMLLDTVHEFLGEDYEPYTMGGGTHARKFPNALPYGPGGVKIKNPFGGAHGIDEACSIDGLLMSMSTYAVALKRLDQML